VKCDAGFDPQGNQPKREAAAIGKIERGIREVRRMEGILRNWRREAKNKISWKRAQGFRKGGLGKQRAYPCERAEKGRSEKGRAFLEKWGARSQQR